MSKITIGTRGSALALWQAEHIKTRLMDECGLDSQIRIIKTSGDKILDVPLAKIGGKGLFTKEIEEMLLSREIDLAVHSLKDVPVDMISELGLAAITKREDSRDCFLSMKYKNLQNLPQGARVGTTSLRRTMQIKLKRSDIDAQSLRGNVQTRLEKLHNGTFDAIILAKAGVERLGIDSTQVRYIEPLDFMITAMGQGALGIEMRNDSKLFDKIATLADKHTTICVSAERAFVRMLNGGCQVPIGVQAQLNDRILHLEAIVGLPNGSEYLTYSLQAECDSLNDAENLGEKLANQFIANGARELLIRAEKMFK